jgi:hypothetical protein
MQDNSGTVTEQERKQIVKQGETAKGPRDYREKTLFCDGAG